MAIKERNFGLDPVSVMIKKCRLRWFGHVEFSHANDLLPGMVVLPWLLSRRRHVARHSGVCYRGYCHNNDMLLGTVECVTVAVVMTVVCC